MIITLLTIAVLLVIVGTILLSTTNKYFTAYQWASWQEALQGAESGADIAMGELRKEIQGGTAWGGWKLGNYKKDPMGRNIPDLDPTKLKTIAADGTYLLHGQGGGGGNTGTFTIGVLAATGYDFVTYKTDLTPHSGEGNNRMTITATVDAPASLLSNGVQWLRVRASGTTDVAGPSRVSEEKLDNRLRKLSLIYDRIVGSKVDKNKPVATRQIELVAKPVKLFSGALMAMVQLKSDKKAGVGGVVTDSFNSEGYFDTVQNKIVSWPTVLGEYDFTMSHDPSTAIGKNGDIGSNAFPIKHDKSEILDISQNVVWGDVGNNYSQIKGLDPAYYNTTYDPTHPTYGLNTGAYATVNPNPALIQANGNGDVSGDITTNFYRDLPPITNPTWTSGNSSDYRTSITVVNNKTADVSNLSTDPANPTRIKVTGINLANKDKWTLKATTQTVGTVVTPVPTYAEIWVTGDIKLDDGGTVVIEDGVQATVYFDRNVKVGEDKETKTNGGGFDNQSDDAKNLLLLGVTEPDQAQKLPKDAYVDPLGNEAVYTPYKATGNISFFENDFTGAIFAPDHNIVFSNTKDGKGKRNKRPQSGNDMYGSFVGRTINTKGPQKFHFDESLNDSGPTKDWGYVSWFEDVDVDNR